MKIQVTLTVDSDIKEEFKKIANKIGANMSTLVNMYFTQVVNTGKINFIYQEKEVLNNNNNSLDISEFSKEKKQKIENLPNFNGFISSISGK